jgi:hypothetical protein
LPIQEEIEEYVALVTEGRYVTKDASPSNTNKNNKKDDIRSDEATKEP